MALIRPPLAPHALGAYRAAEATTRAPAQRTAPAREPEAAPEPRPGAAQSPAPHPALTPRTFSVFAGLIGGENPPDPAGTAPAPAGAPRAASGPERPRWPGSTLDIKI